MKRLELEGKKFGKLTVMSFDNSDNSHGDTFWKCQCDCGKEVIKRGTRLTSGQIKSCGCLGAIGTTNAGWKGVGEISGHRLCSMKTNAKTRDIKFGVTKEYLWKLFLLQNRKCALSGKPLVFGKKQDFGTASLDRIDSSKGYVKGNVQWVHKDINLMKLDHTQEEFVALCKDVVSYMSEGI